MTKNQHQYHDNSRGSLVGHLFIVAYCSLTPDAFWLLLTCFEPCVMIFYFGEKLTFGTFVWPSDDTNL